MTYDIVIKILKLRFYFQILLVEGTTAMDLIIIIYPTERIETMSLPNASPDLKIELLMGSPFVVLLPSFVQNFKV